MKQGAGADSHPRLTALDCADHVPDNLAQPRVARLWHLGHQFLEPIFSKDMLPGRVRGLDHPHRLGLTDGNQLYIPRDRDLLESRPRQCGSVRIRDWLLYRQQ